MYMIIIPSEYKDQIMEVMPEQLSDDGKDTWTDESGVEWNKVVK